MRKKSVFLWVFLFDVLAILGAILVGLKSGQAERYFGEHRFITWVSSLQLLAVSWLAYRTYRVRRSSGELPRGSAVVIWALISFGFLYLVADEYFLFHEAIDHRVHDLLGMKETAFTDRLDDIIVGFYGIIGLGVLYACRKEIRLYRQAGPFLTWGFILMFVMVAADTATNRIDFLTAVLGNDLAGPVFVWLRVAEDSFKILAEACFVGGAYVALTVGRSIGKVATAPNAR